MIYKLNIESQMNVMDDRSFRLDSWTRQHFVSYLTKVPLPGIWLILDLKSHGFQIATPLTSSTVFVLTGKRPRNILLLVQNSAMIEHPNR